MVRNKFTSDEGSNDSRKTKDNRLWDLTTEIYRVNSQYKQAVEKGDKSKALELAWKQEELVEEYRAEKKRMEKEKSNDSSGGRKIKDEDYQRSNSSPYDIRNIEKEAEENDNFRKVLYTGKNLQLVVMSLQPGEDIGMEVHSDVDQFFRVEEGEGEVIINKNGTKRISAGSSIVIKAGTEHNIINTSNEIPLKLYTIYAPPNHPPDRLQETKEEAIAEKNEIVDKRASIKDAALTALRKLKNFFNDAEFREEDHPRAESGKNAGQFIKKGTGGGASSGTKLNKKEKSKSSIETKENKKTKKTANFVETVRGDDGKLKLANGKPLPEHIAHIAIPPAWKNVIINPDPKGDLLVVGIDKKGKAQPKYSKEHEEKALQEQEKMIKRLDKNFQNIMQQLKKDFGGENDNTILTKLIINTGARIDSQKEDMILGEVKTYGASSIEARHIIKTNEGVLLDFIGKKGKKNIYMITDNDVAKILLERKKNSKPNEKIFNIKYKEFLNYVKGLGEGGFTPHDFRTKLATDLAKEQIKNSSIPTNKKEYKKEVKRIGTIVGERLNDTHGQVLKSYIMPSVWEDWKRKAAVQ